MKGSVKFWFAIIFSTLAWVASLNLVAFIIVFIVYLYMSGMLFYLSEIDIHKNPIRYLVPMYILMESIKYFNNKMDIYFHPDRLFLKKKNDFNEDHPDWDDFQEFLKERKE